MMALDEADKAWIAAIIDTHGRLINQHNSPNLRITAIRRDEVADKVFRLVGGKAQVKRSKEAYFRQQCKVHCPKDHVHVRVGVSHGMCILGRSAALIVINGIKPYSACVDRLEDWERVFREDRLMPPRASVIDLLQDIGWSVPLHLSPRWCVKHDTARREYKSVDGYLRLRCTKCFNERRTKRTEQRRREGRA